MSTETQMGTDTTALANTWRYLVGVGIVVSILGILAIVFPLVTGLALSVVFGAFLIVGAIAHGVHVFSARGWAGALAEVLLALLYLVGGVALLVSPVFGLVTLTLVLAVVFVVNGALEAYMGIRLRPRSNWWWPVVSGVLALVIGVLLWVGWPSTAAWAVGLLFGINLLSSGVSMVAVALNGRNAARRMDAVGG